MPTPATDEDLVRRTLLGDDVALDLLLRRYRGLVRLRARSYFLAGAERDDVVQEGMLGLYEAIRDYDPYQRTSFRGFADLCVTRQILSAVKAATRRKHLPLNGYVSLHHTAVGDDGGGEVLADSLTDPRAPAVDPAELIASAAEVDAVGRWAASVLSDLESEVLRRHLDGEGHTAIATAVGRDPKSVDNAMQRVRRKLEGFLAERAPTG